MSKILICHNEIKIRERLQEALSENYNLVSTDSIDQCLDILTHANDIVIVLFDIDMLAVEKLGFIKDIQSKYPKIKVFCLSKAGVPLSKDFEQNLNGHLDERLIEKELLSVVQNNIG